MKPVVFDPNCPAQPLMKACHQLGWLKANARTASTIAYPACSDTIESSEVAQGHTTCWLERLIACGNLKPETERALRRRLGQGFRLTTCDRSISTTASRRWSEHSLAWLGGRYCFGHHTSLHSTPAMSAIVSSRLGRQASQFPAWPTALESLLRDVSRDQSRLLLSPGSTLTDAIREFATIAEIPTRTLQLAKARESLAAWMERVLLQPVGGTEEQQTVELSPAAIEIKSADELGPLQDRAAIYLAERLYCLFIRPGGTIERLLNKRLADDLHGKGSLFLVLSDGSNPPTRDWLDRGAVGWYLPKLQEDAQWLHALHSIPTNCSRRNVRRCEPSVRQLTAALPISWSRGDCQDWDWLTHCTRSSSGPGPDESAAVHRLRLWQIGREMTQHPLSNLDRICREARILGSRRLMRSKLRCVSFSAVPLPELLGRRVYRSHLARWDWEPYGVLISRHALQNLGAKPVMYGSESEFQSLSIDQRPFFQPRGSTQDWTQEQEWRIVGDVDLKSLPSESVRLFTETRQQALRLAGRYSWPVFWTS